MKKSKLLHRRGASLSPNNFASGAQDASAYITSLAGPVLSDAERTLFRQSDPLGFILFARNVEEPDQLYALTESLKETLGRECPILIDQEGGRVARLKPPLWKGYATARTFGAVAQSDFDQGLDDLTVRTLSLAEELRECGINVNCDPVCDVLMAETHDVIGDRAYSDDPALISKLAEHICREYISASITPIMKHIPGHGRARADSHLELPVVEASHAELSAVDFVPFKALAASSIGAATWAMSAHILYTALDDALPLTLSKHCIDEIIRGEIGFDGILVSDDVSMKALSAYGSLPELCCASVKAGCDLALYCAGIFEEAEKIAESVPKLSQKTLERLQKGAA